MATFRHNHSQSPFSLKAHYRGRVRELFRIFDNDEAMFSHLGILLKSSFDDV